jgi:hypothetical protein
MDRRTSIKWVLMASAAWSLAGREAARANPAAPAAPASGYGTDPNLLASYHPGEPWPLTLTPAQRELAAVLADLIVPADERSPSASAVGVVDFIDEWVSAPYKDNQRDRPIVLEGLSWLETESGQRFGKGFAALDASQQHAICDDICDVQRAAPERLAAARFFALFRDLTAGGFYCTPFGRADLGYIGNIALTRFDGPPQALLSKLNLL